MSAIQQAEHVEFHHLLPLGQRRPGRRAKQHDPSVVDQRVQPAQLCDRALHRGRGLFLVRDVALQHQRGAALAPDPRGQFLQPVPPPRGQRHRRPPVGQHRCRGRTDATRRPGHQRDRTLQHRLHPTLTTPTR